MELESSFTMFTSAYHWTLFWASWIQSTPSHPVSKILFILYFSPDDVKSRIVIPYNFVLGSIEAGCQMMLHVLCGTWWSYESDLCKM